MFLLPSCLPWFRIRHGAAEAEALSAGPVHLRKKPQI